MWLNLQETVDLAIFSEEALNGKVYFLCSAKYRIHYIPGISWRAQSIYLSWQKQADII